MIFNEYVYLLIKLTSDKIENDFKLRKNIITFEASLSLIDHNAIPFTIQQYQHLRFIHLQFIHNNFLPPL